ncbi:hypothetical protein F2Q70_00039455 [Brassica cretica]|nr:hypothetical protein F2Q70_00039455 [Brassica cretica]
MLEEIYRTLGVAEDMLDRRCDDIYFPWDITIKESTSIDRHIKISTDSHRRPSIDEATPTDRGQLVTKVTSDTSDTINHGEEISDDTYTTLVRHQFELECLGDRLQKIENATATMKDK